MGNNKNTLYISIILILSTITAILGTCLFLYFNSSSNDKEKKSADEQSEVQTYEDDSDDSSEDIFEDDVDEYLEEDDEDTYDIIEEGSSEDQYITMYVANVSNAVYLRSQPYENSSNIILTIPLGAQVVWLRDENPVFAKVSYGGRTGYVKRDLLSMTPPRVTNTPTPKPSNTTIYKYVYISNVEKAVYLRRTAQENQSNILTTIPLGTRIGFIEYATNGFSKVSYNGTIGYVKTAYLSDYSYTPQYQYMTVCNVANSIYLRSTPNETSGNIICQIPVGSVVRFISNAGGGFYKISWDGYNGYAKSAYLR